MKDQKVLLVDEVTQQHAFLPSDALSSLIEIKHKVIEYN